MEAVAQFGTFVMLKLLKDKRLLPILTGTEFRISIRWRLLEKR